MYDLFRRTGITVFNDPTLRRDVGSFDDYGTTIRFDVGNTLHSAKQTGETSRILTLAADNQRTSVAGVSLDEEMVGLVKYNHAYNGAARVITAMDDALDRLINGTGRVGL
jgi:flagellar hook-associated protein 1 FlgK